MPKAQAPVEAPEMDATLVPSTPSYLDLVTSGSLVSSSVVGGSDAELAEKADLEGKPFIILSCRFQDGDFGLYAIVRLLTSDNERQVITDGSGIFRQLHDYVTRTRQGELPEAATDYPLAIHASHGLRRSDFTYDSETGRALKDGDTPAGKAVPATSWYIA